MPSITKIGDWCAGHDCYPPRRCIEGSITVFIQGKGVHCAGDKWEVHSCKDCTAHDGVLQKGTSTVFANGKAVGRTGDPISCGSFVAENTNSVFIGD